MSHDLQPPPPEMTYRNPQLLRLAQYAPRCMGCGAADTATRATIVAAHSNQSRDGKGAGIKAADFRFAALCADCHYDIDQGRVMTREERVAYWEEAHRATIGWLFEAGYLQVAPLTLQGVPIFFDPPPAPAKPSKPIAKGPKLKGRGFTKDGPKAKIPSRPFGA